MICYKPIVCFVIISCVATTSCLAYENDDSSCFELRNQLLGGGLNEESAILMGRYIKRCEDKEIEGMIEAVNSYHMYRERRDLPNSMARVDGDGRSRGGEQKILQELMRNLSAFSKNMLLSVLSYYLVQNEDDARVLTALELTARIYPENYEAAGSLCEEEEEKSRAWREIADRWL